jgi:hypothetical protein
MKKYPTTAFVHTKTTVVAIPTAAQRLKARLVPALLLAVVVDEASPVTVITPPSFVLVVSAADVVASSAFPVPETSLVAVASVEAAVLADKTYD